MLPPPQTTRRAYLRRRSCLDLRDRVEFLKDSFYLKKPPGGDENCSLVAQCREDWYWYAVPARTIMERLGEAGGGFRSLTEAIDTTTPAGRMMMQMVGAFAEFERAMLRERTKAGLDAAREEGRIGGRRPKLTPQQQAEIRKMVSTGDNTAAEAARLFKIHRATVSRLLARTLPPARKAPNMPNNVDGSAPNNSESDTKAGRRTACSPERSSRSTGRKCRWELRRRPGSESSGLDRRWGRAAGWQGPWNSS